MDEINCVTITVEEHIELIKKAYAMDLFVGLILSTARLGSGKDSMWFSDADICRWAKLFMPEQYQIRLAELNEEQTEQQKE